MVKKQSFRRFLGCYIFMIFALGVMAEKQIYIPTWMMGDVTDASNAWTYTRSKQSENWILFWEKGYGENPKTFTCGNYTVNINTILNLADDFFDFYADSLKFITRGQSKTDTYKMIIRLRYTSEWEATGSGVDNTIGLLTLTAWSAAAAGHTLAHEVGHCFQYQVHCDNNNQDGWMYGFGDNASGGCAWWEQCAQWQGFKIYPAQQFTNSRFSGYMKMVHKHPLHETPRYENYFIQDYWCYLHGIDFIARLWNESQRPEDPIDTYKRITNITQSQFNDEMYICAARFASWDIPALKTYGVNYINARPQPKMNKQTDGYWMIDASCCPENYGHNIIKLNIPEKAVTVAVTFEAKQGTAGFRMVNKMQAGWRYGFVALLKDGRRLYSDMHRLETSIKEVNPTDTLTFDCPANCQNLWLVVSGAPKGHWKHAWDDDATNDEQWPYQVKFTNTNILGEPTIETTENELKIPLLNNSVDPSVSTFFQIDTLALCQTFGATMAQLRTGLKSSLIYYGVKPDGGITRIATYNTYGHWFDRDGNIVSKTSTARAVFSEFDVEKFGFHIGQYPDVCQNNDTIYICQALEYKANEIYSYWVNFKFKIIIENPTNIPNVHFSDNVFPVQNTLVKNAIYLKKTCRQFTLFNVSGMMVAKAQNISRFDVSQLSCGIYVAIIDGSIAKICVQR